MSNISVLLLRVAWTLSKRQFYVVPEFKTRHCAKGEGQSWHYCAGVTEMCWRCNRIQKFLSQQRKEFVLPFSYIYNISVEMLAFRLHVTWFLDLLQITSRGKHKGAISKTFFGLSDYSYKNLATKCDILPCSHVI